MLSPDLLEDIEVISEDNDEDESPFIRVRRLQLRHVYSGNEYSTPYLFYMIEGPFADAVAVILYHIDMEGKDLGGFAPGSKALHISAEE